MSKVSDISEVCGDYAIDVEYGVGNVVKLFFNSYRNARTVKRCIEVDDSIPNVATAVDFVEVVRCKDCKFYQDNNGGYPHPDCKWGNGETPDEDDFCSAGERIDNAT